jgi:hypothetical protein
MFPADLSDNIRQSLVLAGLLQKLNSPTSRELIVAACESVKPNVSACRYSPPTADHLGQAVVRWVDTMLILIQGVTHIDQASAYTNAIVADPEPTEFGGLNDYINTEVSSVKSSLDLISHPSPLRYLLAGHSLGGTVASVLGEQLRRSRFPASVSAVSFGAPRPGPIGTSIELGSLDLTRWMNVDDPVPCLPPNATQATFLHLLLSSRESRLYGAMRHPIGGIELAADGTAEPRAAPSNFNTGLTLSVMGWLTGSLQNNATPHSMHAYEERLAQRIALQPAVPDEEPGAAQPERGHARNPGEIRRAIATAENKFREQSRLRNLDPVHIPPDKAFSLQRVGPVYGCALGGVLFSVAPTRRRARHLARLGNDFLDRLQLEGIVDAQVLADLWIKYLMAAADPSGGFTPPMNS